MQPPAPGSQPPAPGFQPRGAPDRRTEAAEHETTAGLPRRVPRANLAPGILAQRERALREDAEEAHRQARSPEEVRSLLANYRAGIERGRRTAGDQTEGGWDADAVMGDDYDEPG
jgi:hypothetical protein